MSNTELDVASSWITAFNDAASQGDVERLLACMEPDCWFRDILVFTPNVETRHGHAAIRAHLQETLSKAQVSNVVLDSDPHGRPHASEFGLGTPIIMSAFDFETPVTLGKGYVRLYYPKDGETPKAFCMMMMLSDWKGHEEVKNESGVYEGHNLSWGEVYRQRRAEIERDPQAIIGKWDINYLEHRADVD